MGLKAARAAGLVLAALGVLAGGAHRSALAQTCGSVITQSTVLHGNIGPCTGSGLIIPDEARNISIDLNGHTITGTNAPGSAGIHSRGLMIFIKGPGTIVNFESGVLVQRYGTQKATVEEVALARNRWGINVLANCETMADNRILRNKITGPGEVGIRTDCASFTLISENWITGQTVAGIIDYNGRQTLIERNEVRANEMGIFLNGWAAPTTVRNNYVVYNRLDGIVALSQSTIANNGVQGNGRDGIAAAAFWPGTQEFNTLILSNTVMSNGRRGIALGYTEINPAESITHSGGGNSRVAENIVRANRGVDLFWDRTGPNNCWTRNNYGLSDPAALPACQ